jgi:hypothetical protein
MKKAAADERLRSKALITAKDINLNSFRNVFAPVRVAIGRRFPLAGVLESS